MRMGYRPHTAIRRCPGNVILLMHGWANLPQEITTYDTLTGGIARIDITFFFFFFR